MLFLAVLTFSIILLPSASAAKGPFSDIASDAPIAPAVNFLKEKDVIRGYADGSFHPDSPISRAEMLALAERAFSTDQKDQNLPVSFSDVDEEAWYYDVIARAYLAKYIAGYTDGTFRPNAPVNNAEALKMILTRAGTSLTSAEGLKWYTPFFDFAREKKIILLPMEKEWDPAKVATRGDISVLLFRTYRVMVEKEAMADEKEAGKISYYADKFIGKSTSSGEKYDAKLFTAAHRTYGFGTIVQVTDPSTGRALLVRVNDRGPFSPAYVLDLSKSAFESFYGTSRGIFNGYVDQVNFFHTSFQKFYYAKDALAGCDLEDKLPNMFTKGEVYTLRCKNGNPEKIEIKNPSGTIRKSECGEKNCSLVFEEEGESVLIPYTANGRGKELQVTVYDKLFGHSTKNVIFPDTKITVSADGVLSWDISGEANIYKIEIENPEGKQLYYVHGSSSLILTKQNLEDVTVRVSAGITSTGFSQDVYTGFIPIGEKHIP